MKTVVLLLLLVFAINVVASASTAQDGTSQNGRPAQTDNASRSEELLARRLQRLNALEPAKADKLTDILATTETDGLDQRMSVRLGR